VPMTIASLASQSIQVSLGGDHRGEVGTLGGAGGAVGRSGDVLPAVEAAAPRPSHSFRHEEPACKSLLKEEHGF
jgi:hypothetical protein